MNYISIKLFKRGVPQAILLWPRFEKHLSLCGPRSDPTGLPQSSLEMQILRPHHRPRSVCILTRAPGPSGASLSLSSSYLNRTFQASGVTRCFCPPREPHPGVSRMFWDTSPREEVTGPASPECHLLEMSMLYLGRFRL